MGRPRLGPWREGDSGSRDSSAPSHSLKESDPPVAVPRGGFSPRSGLMCRVTPPLGGPWRCWGPPPLAALPQEEARASAPSSRPARQGMEPGRSVPAELKLRKPSQRARIPAPFLAHSVGRWLGPRPPVPPFAGRSPSSPP